MADTSKPDQDLTSGGQDLPPSTEEKTPEDVVTEKENESEKDGSTVSTAKVVKFKAYVTTRNRPRRDSQRLRIS